MNILLKENYWNWLKNPQKKFDYLSLLLFGIFILLAIRYQIKLLHYMEWGDESETIVAAKMIAANSSLYSQVFNHHGPLTFLPGFLLEKLENFGVAGHRVPIAILQIIAICSIYFSPLLKNGFTKYLYTAIVVTVMLLFLPKVFGHMYKYQVLAGLLLVIILAQYTLPSLISSIQLPPKNIVIGNILISSLSFLAISYIPLSIFLFFASLRKEAFVKSFVSFLAGFAANILFLILIGSVAGFLAFHVYLNLNILPSFLPLYNSQGVTILQLIITTFNNVTSSFGQFFLFLLLITATSFLAFFEKKIPWRSILIFLGIGSLLIREINFHALPYFYSLLAFPLVFFYNRSIITRQSQLAVLLLILICTVKLSLLIPRDQHKLKVVRIPESTEFSQFAQFFTEKNDRIIAYSFQNFQYIAADRLPASGHYFYLPWQEKYNENPKFGIRINACKEISDYRPKVMLIDKWKVWDKFSWESYGSCIQKLLDSNYVQWPDKPYYLRKDLLTENIEVPAKGAPRKMQPSPLISPSNSLPISMALSHQKQNNALKRIGIMFGTYNRHNTGVAELRLTGPDGSQWSQRFSMADLVDNKYRYFDLDFKRYSTGEVVSISGSGVSTWESHDDKGGALTCINYTYVDGKRGFTPGCPPF